MGKGNPNDRTWQYVTAALARAQAHAKKQGYRWNGESCFVVSGFALGLVMDTRNSVGRWAGGGLKGDGGPTLPADNPRAVELAYADHYFQTRMMSGAASLGGAAAGGVATYGYDAYKSIVLWMKNQRMPTPSLMPGGPWDLSAGMPDAARAGMFVMSIFCNAIADAGDRWERSRRENPNIPMSLPTEEGRYWAIEGSKDGVADNVANPMQFVDLLRRAG
jgi:hypothetical protein